jgi:hypothetical protein
MSEHAKPEDHTEDHTEDPKDLEITHVEDVQEENVLPAPLKGNLTADVIPPQHEEPPQGEDVKPASHDEPPQGEDIKPAGAGLALSEKDEDEE